MSRRAKGRLLIAVAAGLFSAGVAQAQLITGVSESGTNLNVNVAHFTGQVFDHPNEGVGFTVPYLDEDVTFFTNRTHEYNGVSAARSIASMGLTGAEYIMIANENRDVGNYKLTTTVSAPVEAYVFMDARNAAPAWLSANGWSFLGSHQMGIDEGGDGVGPGVSIQNRFWIWRKSVTEGSFETLERGGSGNNMYGVAVLPAGMGPSYAPFVGADWQAGNFGMIDLGATGGRAQPGALQDSGGVGQIGGGADGNNNVNLAPRQMTSALGDTFTIAIDNVDQTGAAVGAIDWRDRGDSLLTGAPFNLPLAQLAEDHLKNNQGVIRVILGDLPAGIYEVTSFHVDADNSQCEAIKVLVDVGDGNGYVDTGAMGNAFVHPGNEHGVFPELVLNSAATFTFTADGVHDVMILFDGRAAADKELPLSGLSISVVPEPAAFGLVALGGLVGLARRKRN